MARIKAKQVSEKDINSKSVSHNWEGLAHALFEEMNLLRAGLIPVARARTTANLAKRIIDGAALDYCVKKNLGGADLKRMLSES